MPAPTVIAAPGRLRPGGAAGAVHMTVSASRSRSPSRLTADTHGRGAADALVPLIGPGAPDQHATSTTASAAPARSVRPLDTGGPYGCRDQHACFQAVCLCPQPGGLGLGHRRALVPRPSRKGSGRPEPDLLAGRRDPGDLDVTDADLTGEPGDPPDDCPGCFGGGRGIAGLALDRVGGLIQLVPACSDARPGRQPRHEPAGVRSTCPFGP
jgi:hypothetical protein